MLKGKNTRLGGWEDAVKDPGLVSDQAGIEIALCRVTNRTVLDAKHLGEQVTRAGCRSLEVEVVN